MNCAKEDLHCCKRAACGNREPRMGADAAIRANASSTASSGSKSRVTLHRILPSQIRDSPNLEDHDPIFISPRNRVGQLHPQALGSFPSSPSTRRSMVEVIEPTSIRACRLKTLVLVMYSLGTDSTENTAS
jgi:hypothetical protein